MPLHLFKFKNRQMNKIEKKDAGVGNIVGPFPMSLKSPALGTVKWFTSYKMGPYNEDKKVIEEHQDYFAPLLKLRWIKTKEQTIKNPIDPDIFFRLVVEINYNHLFFIPLFVDQANGKVIRPDIQVSFLGKSIMITIGLITYLDAGIEVPIIPKTSPVMSLTKYSEFSFDFDQSFTEMIKNTGIYVSCIYGDPEESTISKVIVEDVDEL